MAQSDLTGHTLGQYTITSRLGRGGMADVYKAYHPKLEVYRAIKVIRPEFVTTSDFRERFQKEAQSVAALRHPNIVQIHDFGEQDDAYYMVMEFIEGQDLKRVIKSEGKIRPIRRALEIVDQVADALHYAHSRGLVHRDIKPENVMINEDGLPILMDFGIAKLLTAKTQLTQTGMGIGTPAYMAPEQAQALPEIGPAADIYSLSVVLYEMLTGQVPFSADTPMAVMLKAINDPMPMPRQFSADISEDLQQVILKGTAKDAGNRYGSARQLRKALQEAIDKEPEAPAATEFMAADQATAQAAAQAEPTRKRPTGGKSRAPLAILSLVILALAVGGGYWYFRAGPSGSGPVEIAERDEPTTPAEATGESAAPPDQTVAGANEEAGAGEARTPAEPGPGPAAEEPVTTAAEPAALDAGSIDPGERIRGQGSVPGQALSYALEADAGETIYFDHLSGGGTTAFRMNGPEGGAPVFDSRGDHGPVTLEQGGSYTLTATPGAGQTADFEFVLRKLDTVVIDGGRISLGRQASGETEVPGQQVAYELDAQSGQKLQFELAGSAGATEFTLTAPDARTRVFRTQGNHGPVTLDQSGTYTLTADPSEDNVGEFAFVLREWRPPVTDGGVLRLGNFVRDSFAVPGRAVAYELDADAGQTVFFDHVDTQQSTRRITFTLTAPDGRSKVWETRGDHGPVTLESSGTYRLVAAPRDNRADAYEFVIWGLEPAVIDGGSISLGAPVEGRTSVPGQTVAYRLQASAGQSISFDHVESTESTDFILTAPDGGTRVFSSQGDHGPVVLNQTGTYRLVADPRDDWVSEFEFVLRPGGAG